MYIAHLADRLRLRVIGTVRHVLQRTGLAPLCIHFGTDALDLGAAKDQAKRWYIGFRRREDGARLREQGPWVARRGLLQHADWWQVLPLVAVLRGKCWRPMSATSRI